MSQLFPQRMTAELDGDFVVFVIGMRINRPWKIHKWLPVFRAMPRMLRELEAHPECGFLGAIRGWPAIIQYWRSFEHLERYARDHDHEHWPAWVAFNKQVSVASGDVGIWHETYLVRAGEFEAIYGAMPRYGLAAAGRHVAISASREDARDRIGAPGAVRAPADARIAAPEVAPRVDAAR